VRPTDTSQQRSQILDSGSWICSRNHSPFALRNGRIGNWPDPLIGYSARCRPFGIEILAEVSLTVKARPTPTTGTPKSLARLHLVAGYITQAARIDRLTLRSA